MARLLRTMATIPVVDLFAGPGGLNEGFHAHAGLHQFHTVLSVEKDPAAHRTLELRTFFRRFPKGAAPEKYYFHVRGEGVSRDELFEAYPDQASKAAQVAWKAELGREPLEKILERIRSALNNRRHWVLLGGPPCQAYSVIGRARMKNREDFAKDERHTLYREYLKIVAAFQPTVFVMENVKGILSSSHQDKIIFGKIHKDMSDPWDALSETDRRSIPKPAVTRGYRIFSFCKDATGDGNLKPLDYVIESERYGIPQRRHRVIFLGIRDDYDVLPEPLQESPRRIRVRDVLADLPCLRSRLSQGDLDARTWTNAIRANAGYFLQEISDSKVRTAIESTLGSLASELQPGAQFMPSRALPAELSEWYLDPRLGGVLQHESRAHMPSDLHRYLFATCFAQIHKRSTRINDFPPILWPNHRNVQRCLGEKVDTFEDRFRVQVWEEPSTTVTAHLSKDGHYFIHADPLQCRTLTVREAARLQTFPDNYFFEGNRGQQFQQVGNAVPPLLARQLADTVSVVMEQCMDRDLVRSPVANIRRVAMP